MAENRKMKRKILPKRRNFFLKNVRRRIVKQFFTIFCQLEEQQQGE